MERAITYRQRAVRYLENFEEERAKGEQEKSGEALWGVVSSLVNALHLVELGKPAQGHSEQTRFAEIYITSQLPNAEELLKAHKYVERFHTNFYHAFLGQQEFDELASKIRQLIEALDTALKQRLEELEGPFGTWVPSSSDE